MKVVAGQPLTEEEIEFLYDPEIIEKIKQRIKEPEIKRPKRDSEGNIIETQ